MSCAGCMRPMGRGLEMPGLHVFYQDGINTYEFSINSTG